VVSSAAKELRFVFESKDLLENALRWALYDRLCSAVYYALNFGLSTDQDPDEILEDWRNLDAGGLANLLVLSLSPDGAFMPNAIRVDPWVAPYLRPYDEPDFFPIIERWLAKHPLDERICEDPRDEDMKVRRLKNLVSAIDAEGKPTAGKIINTTEL
jgi:hypothetical protein